MQVSEGLHRRPLHNFPNVPRLGAVNLQSFVKFLPESGARPENRKVARQVAANEESVAGNADVHLTDFRARPARFQAQSAGSRSLGSPDQSHWWDGFLMGSAKWKKLKSGDWAVENVGTPARVGDLIAVTRRAGGIDRLVVRKVIWEGHGKQWLTATRPTTAERGGGTVRHQSRGVPE